MSETQQDAPVIEDAPLLGAMPRQEALAKLAEMGDPYVAEIQEEIANPKDGPDSMGLESVFDNLFGRKPPAYMHTTMTVGYLPRVNAGQEPPPMMHAGRIEPELALRNQRITITLDRLRVADFPGKGMHHVLFDFRARNQTISGPVEDIHFNTTSRVLEGEHAPVMGYPIFVGLRVGEEGVGFEGFTVNVKNETDEQFLNLLESDAFKTGLTLMETAQPALKPLSQMAVGMATAIAKRNKNVKVQEFNIGLDFSSIAMGARLAQGSYVVVQIPETQGVVWRWSEWVYDPDSGYIVSKTNPAQTIPYNYVVFSVSKYGG